MSFLSLAKTSLIATFVAALSACGGGGIATGGDEAPKVSSSIIGLSSSSSSSAPSKQSQTLIFKDAKGKQMAAGESFNNPALGQGTGAITYQSSNTEVATVDQQGVVTMATSLNPSQLNNLTITATIAADEKFAPTSASYDIYVLRAMCDQFRQSITFTQNQVQVQTGETFTNSYTQIGNNTISYSSNNPSVASVDSRGLVTAITRGEAIISANMPGGDGGCIAPAYAAYTVKVVERATTGGVVESGSNAKVKDNNGVTLAIPELAMSAWIGKKDSLISFPVSSGFTFYSTSDSDCDFSHVANCTHGQLALLNGTTITDTATTLAQPGYYLLKDSNDYAAFRLLSNASFSPRAEHQVVTFDGKLLLIGGYLGLRNFESPDLKNDVWASDNGIAWSEQTGNAGFSPRTGQKVVVFNDSLWLIGGNDRSVDYLIPGDDNGRKNDVWSSRDGITWTQQLSKASFSARTGHQVVSFNNKLWVIGGDDKNGLKNDIWSSSNGITWIRQVANASFSPRADHQVLAFKGKLWLVGGGDKNDLWSSVDGISWTQETASTAFPVRSGYQVAAYADKLWVIGGYDDNGYSNEVWSSSDGVTWAKSAEDMAFTPSAHFQLLTFAGRLLLIGGYTQHGFSNEAWSTTDGVEWRKGFSGTFQFPQ